MNIYALVTQARTMARRSWLGAPACRMLLTLADELEMSVTKLRDKEWDREWAAKRRREKEIEYHRERSRVRRVKLKIRK